MIRKLQNSEMLPANVSQPEVESFYAGKNEISIESIELTSPKKETDNDAQASLIGERKLQAELQAAELNRQLGIVTDNKDPEK